MPFEFALFCAVRICLSHSTLTMKGKVKRSKKSKKEVCKLSPLSVLTLGAGGKLGLMSFSQGVVDCGRDSS